MARNGGADTMSFIASALNLAAPEAAIVTKVVEVVAVLGLLGSAVLYLEYRGAVGELGKLQKSSTKLLAKADEKIKQQTVDHAAFVADNRSTTNALLDRNKSLSDTLDKLVRDSNAYRASHPDVPRPPGGPAAAPARDCGSLSCGDLAVLLAERGNDLFRSSGELDASLRSCQHERDSLTGLP